MQPIDKLDSNPNPSDVSRRRGAGTRDHKSRTSPLCIAGDI